MGGNLPDVKKDESFSAPAANFLSGSDGRDGAICDVQDHIGGRNE